LMVPAAGVELATY